MGHSDDMVVLSTPEILLVLFMVVLSTHEMMQLLPGHAAQATPQMSSASSGGSSRGEVKCFVDR